MLPTFPFLIGRIRTIIRVCDYLGYEWFPFLIGRIRTQFDERGCIFIEPGFHSS